MKFYDVFIAGCIFTSLLTSILLFTKGRYQLHANRLLGTVIFTWCWYVLLYLLMITGWIKFVPGIFRIGSPLYYLVPCCSYLYTRSILLDETKFRKYDWLHFIPAFINVVDLLPYYFADMETKRAVVNAVAQNFNMSYQKGSGFIPAFWHFQLRWILGIIYLFFQWRLLNRIIQLDKLEAFKQVKGWLITFTVFCSVIYIGLGGMSVIAWINLGSSMNIMSSGRSIPTTLQIIGFISLSLYLFFKPDILYGIPRTIYSNAGSKTPIHENNPAETSSIASDTQPEELDENELQMGANRTAPFNLTLMEAYVDQLETYLAKEESFKTQGININQLALALGMPAHHLSYVLNHHYHQRFTDFINTYRVNYIKKRMESENWRSFTLEGLAIDAGFSSRSTFFSAFKKTTGMNPSKYLELRGQ